MPIKFLKQIQVHPVHEDAVHYILNFCFKHLRYCNPGETLGPNAASIHTIADLYAKVLSYTLTRCYPLYLVDLQALVVFSR